MLSYQHRCPSGSDWELECRHAKLVSEKWDTYYEGTMSVSSISGTTVWLQYFEGLNFRSLMVNPLFGNFHGIYFRCMHYHLLVTE